MRKIVSLLLALLLLCCTLSAPAESAEPAVFYLQTMTIGEDTYNAADFGMSVVLTLNPDGTGSIEKDGEGSEITWTKDGDRITVTMDDQPVECTVNEDGLTMTEDGSTMCFTTTPPEKVNLGNIVPAADMSAFNGTWNCTHVSLSGQVVGMALMADYWEMFFGSTDTTITVEDGRIAIFGSEAVEFTFADGRMTYSVEGNDVSTRIVELTDEGRLVFTMASMELSCYCEAAVQ